MGDIIASGKGKVGRVSSGGDVYSDYRTEPVGRVNYSTGDVYSNSRTEPVGRVTAAGDVYNNSRTSSVATVNGAGNISVSGKDGYVGYVKFGIETPAEKIMRAGGAAYLLLLEREKYGSGTVHSGSSSGAGGGSYIGTSGYQGSSTQDQRRQEEQGGTGWAIAGIVCVIISLFLIPVLFGIFGLFLGSVGYSKGSRGLGMAAIVISIGIVLGELMGIHLNQLGL